MDSRVLATLFVTGHGPEALRNSMSSTSVWLCRAWWAVPTMFKGSVGNDPSRGFELIHNFQTSVLWKASVRQPDAILAKN
jgi:hypothetical protein